MRHARNLLALVLALSMSPAIVEVVEDGAHLVLDGQTDHAEDADACPEHGCTPTSHHCACCISIALAGASIVAGVPASDASRRGWALDPDLTGPRGVLTELERPPRA